MKKINLNKSLFTTLVLSTVLAFTACSSDSDTSFNSGNEVLNTTTKDTPTAEQAFSFVIKATSNGSDVTTKGDVKSATLFVFDENNDFIKQIEIDKTTILNRKKISITAPNTNNITVVAWAGLTNNKEEVSSLNQTNILSDLRVQLKQNIDQVATSPSDLFYGQLKISKSSDSENVQTLNVERKISALTLSTKNVALKFGNTEGDFYYRITTKNNAFDHNGKLSGTTAQYILPAYINTKGNLTAESISVLPSDEVTVELFRDDIMVLSSKKSKKTENLSLNEAEQLNISMDFYNSNFSVIAAEYGVILQVVNVG